MGSTLTPALTSTSGTPVMGTDYRVQWYRTVNGTETAIPSATALTYTATKADLGAALKVVLIADQTAAIPAVAPDAPVLSASADDGEVSLSWSATFNGGSAITGYQLFVKSGSGEYGATTDSAASATTYEAMVRNIPLSSLRSMRKAQPPLPR